MKKLQKDKKKEKNRKKKRAKLNQDFNLASPKI
jgi:hypothetical protein